jgi:hypothetical protein
MKRYVLATLALCAFGALASANAVDCTITVPGPGGTAVCPDPVDGKDGKNGLNGSDADISKAMAVSAALSVPVWLESGERFAVSGGLGFTEDETAVGATGIVRLDKNWSAFAGGAMSTEDSKAWAGRAGARVGF